MTLEELNNQIHAITNVADMTSQLTLIKSNIKAALNAGGATEEHYYKNHTGRELFRKLSDLGMTDALAFIGDTFDSGFRPTSVTGIKSA